ncbi:uncharacterized protein LOC111696374 [Eurytemora carolleeae]|uniref:uncharacterized protein LOC111696374 n=1 Tax=Eurytemora carolleeae TaxID=1294199 RepID=UPI000C78CD2F|nr:uncharacterized protein LOC111696374 [Eurytemora carolleeae]|eukprot:XP_023321737.1 uncharacterized protein LOC111696374 [Eurytemora affinis]
MEKIETFWQNLFKKKKKKDNKKDRGENKENEPERIELTQQVPEKVVVKQHQITQYQGSETFPRGKNSAPSSPEPGVKLNPATSAYSLRPRRQELYDKYEWSSNQHFHIPQGTQRYQSTIPRWKSSSRGALSATSLDFSRSLPRSHSPGSNTTTTTMRKPIEPSVSSQHFHLPTRKKRMVYGRPGQKTGMTVLVNEMKARAPCRSRSPSMNNEEPIQLAHFPSGIPKDRQIVGEDSTFSCTLEDRKRRLGDEDDVLDEGVYISDEENMNPKLKKTEEELSKISSGIGKVFLETIRQTERIKGSKLLNIDPRSAARTPGANREPRYKLRYNSPAWASPSRDTMHARPWDSIEDLERPVVLSSSGCASGCASDHCPPANSAPFSLTPTLPRHCKPGYTHLKSNTMPHIRSVSGRILDDEVDPGLGYDPAATSTPTPGDQPTQPGTLRHGPVNTHSGVLYTTNNNFSWLTLAKFHNEDTLRRSTTTKFFHKPELRHNNTILDQ